MDAGFKRFALFLFLFTAVITLAGYLVMKYLLPGHYFTGCLFLPLMLYIVTIAVHRYLIIASREEDKKFTYRFIGATGIKMAIYMVFLVVYLLLDREHAMPFLICFLVLYVFYSVFEVLAVLKYLKNNK